MAGSPKTCPVCSMRWSHWLGCPRDTEENQHRIRERQQIISKRKVSAR